jgi:segregation and condensation protein A
MSYLVNLDKFYGPLDLLLYLIEKEEMDIYDIPIALIADQYMDYVHTTGPIELDNIGDFLVMASYLLNLKSRMLLPGLLEEENESDVTDPREELVNRILEYKQYKQAGEFLASRYIEDVNRVFFRNGLNEIEWTDREISSSLHVLRRAWFSVMERTAERIEYELPQSDLNIGTIMDFILRLLPANGTTVIFQDFYAGTAVRSEAVAYFIALLELIRLQKVSAFQEQRFGDIKLCLRVGLDNVDAG